MHLQAKRWLALLLPATVAACVIPGTNDLDRHLVYFGEFSANLSDEARHVIADSAQQARLLRPSRIRVEARASATGTPGTNLNLAETRASIVADELQADGVTREKILKLPIGQTGSGDPGLTDRRVDIILER